MTEDVQGFKNILTRENINSKDAMEVPVLEYFCTYGPDDPSLLFYLLDLGAILTANSLYEASTTYRPILLRTLLNLGLNPNHKKRGIPSVIWRYNNGN